MPPAAAEGPTLGETGPIPAAAADRAPARDTGPAPSSRPAPPDMPPGDRPTPPADAADAVGVTLEAGVLVIEAPGDDLAALLRRHLDLLREDLRTQGFGGLAVSVETGGGGQGRTRRPVPEPGPGRAGPADPLAGTPSDPALPNLTAAAPGPVDLRV